MRTWVPLAALAATMPAGTADPADARPGSYAGQQTRSIKALSAEEIASLRNGEGMGMAKAGELNHYPGPLHVLLLADQLALTADQRRAIEAVRARMSAAAVSLGEDIIAREQELDRLFADNQITPERLATATAAIGGLHGRLRAVHLAAHLDTRALLTEHQIVGYDALRGYSGGAPVDHGHPGHRR